LPRNQHNITRPRGVLLGPAVSPRRRRVLWIPALVLALAAAPAGVALDVAHARRQEQRTHHPRATRPVNTSPPTISGAAQSGSQLTASPGAWTGSPTSFAFKWLRCIAGGPHCKKIRGASSASYTPAPGDVGSTLKVSVVAYNPHHSRAVSSAATAPISQGSGGVTHLEYVLQDGTTYVYEMDNGYRLAKTISLSQAKSGIRGVMVSPASHLMFISFGGDGGPNGNGSVLAYDLVTSKVVWEVHLSSGIDSGQVSPDGSKIYMPTGELTESGTWDVMSTQTGKVTGTIAGGAGPHNTVVSPDGRYVYLGGRNYNYLDVYETATGAIKKLGPLVGTVRPLTANGKNTLAFTTATAFDGFQVSSVSSGKVLFTVSFGEVPGGFPYSAPSHGISLSPDGHRLSVLDTVHKQVQFWDVSRVAEGVAPSQIGVVGVSGLSGEASPCAYDCGRSGWLQPSTDGTLLFVGDSGDVIDTRTRKVITTLSTLLNTKKSIEVDWQGGVPVATSTRTGVSYAE
jgi:Ig domain of plant-specific actin-binding protein